MSKAFLPLVVILYLINAIDEEAKQLLK